LRSRGGLLAKWAVAGVGFPAGGAEFDDAETGRRPVGEAPPPGRVVRSKGTGEAVSARAERADWTDWVVRNGGVGPLAAAKEQSERRFVMARAGEPRRRHGWYRETLRVRSASLRVTHRGLWCFSLNRLQRNCLERVALR